MTDFETIRYHTGEGLARITLARPEKRNAINSAMFAELAQATAAAAADPDVRVVLLDAEGPAFCAGIDLALLAELSGAIGSDPHSFVARAQEPFRTLATMTKPAVAAVQGHAIGAGFQLALACDLRIAADDASFAILEPRYGIIPDLGGAYHLARMLGPARAKELVWTTRSMDAAEAERVGLVNAVVTSDSLAKEAEAMVDGLLSVSPIPLSLTKSLIDGAHEIPLAAELEREAEAQVRCLTSEDHREAISAYFEKRPARFTGR